ncbi:Uncharacterised protein [Corynebacterium imitans]|uniref:Holin n=1 Tax=Corynebacterium imitans TaxID=156978 RepID=A0A239ZJP4_9CORY|nr:hypothetical protein [Corynebacterium imitans]SNV70894.1 Uncharacterised protein [Corynebacterium imitans]
MNPQIQIAVENALAAQPWWARRKDTITAVAGTIMQLANVAVAYTADGPEWASVAVALLIGLCQIVVHAGTPGAITPSMAARLEDEAPAPDDEGGLADGAQANELAGIAMANPDDPGVYEGAHRAE